MTQSETSRRDYATVTAAYWAYTLSDGALRMMVLLHLHELGYSPLQIVSMFLAYEICGVVTNLLGGYLAARSGLRLTLLLGLVLQVVACAVLALSAGSLSLLVLLGAQAMSGVAKDLTKMSAKSFVRLLVPDGEAQGLLRWVAVLTGSKNALKGLGFFLGAVLLAGFGFAGACWVMAAGLGLAFFTAAALLPRAAGRSPSKPRLKELIQHQPRVQWLSLARLFLFASRDIWFVLALPVFLSAGLGWSFAGTGGFLACWVIGYGIVQALAPRYLGASPGAGRLLLLAVLLLAAVVLLLVGMQNSAEVSAQSLVLIAGLGVFGLIFAANSALHSYLIVAYADQEGVSLKVGYYYMANALGRLVGTLLSGWVFQWAGQGLEGVCACLLGSAILVAASALAVLPLRRFQAAGAGEGARG